MIARLLVLAPFALSVPEGARFGVPEYQWDDQYRIRFYPPKRDSDAATNDLEVKIGDNPAFQADLIHIDFIKPQFDRSIRTTANPLEPFCDPPHSFINEVLEWFLLRLRHVTRAAAIRPFKLTDSHWRVQYLNDDESELPQEKDFPRVRGGLSRSISWIALTNSIWNDLHALPPEYLPPPWEGLLLDASLPGTTIGGAIVLAATALEVFIAYVLDKLASSTTIPTELWTWVNHRNDFYCEPSVEEQYDSLLKILCGHSLKEESKLWEAFKHLKSARNSFVHDGIARIGRTGEAMDSAKAATFVAMASEIIEKVRLWIPEQFHWRKYDQKIQVAVSFPLGR